MNCSVSSREGENVHCGVPKLRVQGSGFRMRRRTRHPEPRFPTPDSRRPTPDSRLPPRGISVLEVSMALLILCFAVGGLLQILTIAASQRRTTEVRRLALAEIANQAEQIALIPWGELTEGRLQSLQPSEQLLGAASNARLTVTQIAEAGPPVAKRIHLEVQWTSPAGDPVQPVLLTVWRHQPTEIQP
jgi:hypothetical protein